MKHEERTNNLRVCCCCSFSIELLFKLSYNRNVCVKALRINTWTQHRLTKNLADRTRMRRDKNNNQPGESVALCQSEQTEWWRRETMQAESTNSGVYCFWWMCTKVSNGEKSNETTWKPKHWDALPHTTSSHPYARWLIIILKCEHYRFGRFYWFLFCIFQVSRLKIVWTRLLLSFVYAISMTMRIGYL